MSDAERGWLDAYHARVRDAHEERLAAPVRAWLEQATRPL
ncbi:MAG: M24 family metallopeptidase C-terminal domain-containing protein [Kiloniellaceae bacterium]